MIELNPSRCVRYYAKASGCDRCESICPTKAIEVETSQVKLYNDRCIDCGACMGVCPTEALRLTSIDPIEFAFSFLKSQEKVISCKSNFVCLAGLNVEYLIAFGLLKEVILDIGHCKSCEIATSCLPQIEHNIAEANYVLATIGGKEIAAKELAIVKEEVADRRDFFNVFTLQGAVKIKNEFDEEIKALDDPAIALDVAAAQAMKQKDIPNKRKLLFSILKRSKKPTEYKYLENEHLSFTSNKEIDYTCDNCSMCYRICPTAALSSNKKQSKIFFDPLLCVRCHLCHDVCEKKSIDLADYFDTKEFFEPSQKVLTEFEVVRCEDCGEWFSYFGEEELLCPRCRAEDEAAKELWGLR